jgi:GPI mannosyltransferase 2
MLSCARKSYINATLLFVLAACLRSNGSMLAGFILWDVIAEPVLRNKKVIRASFSMCLRLTKPQVSARHALLGVLATALISLPFVMHQYSAYRVFCNQDHSRYSWCLARIPSVYGYVQAKYWNSGFLLYWTPAQLPNILLAMPILLSVLSFAYSHFCAYIAPALLRHPLVSNSVLSGALRVFHKPDKSIFLRHSITPHVIHSFIMCNILLFAAHTQIALRLAASMPTTYWAAARLMVDHPRIGKWWVGWSVVWGAVSVVLWAVFLPPA